jgi:nucleolar protein 53
MGKKLRGAALRAKKRSQTAVDELQELQAEKYVTDAYKGKHDGELFVLDTVGDKKNLPLTLKPQPIKKTKRSKNELSDKDKKKIERLQQQHSAEELAQMVAKGKIDMELRQRVGPRRKRLTAASATPSFDMWKEDETKSQQVREKANSRASIYLAGIKPSHETVKAKRLDEFNKKQAVAVDVAKAGQSYRPEPGAHNLLIKKAAELEVMREQTIEELKKPLAQGMSAETRALLLGDSSDEESSSDSENGEDDTPVGAIPRREDKLTRAQRNKQKRLREESTAARLAKRQKLLEKQVGELPKFKKDLKQKERQAAQPKLDVSVRVPGKDIEEAAFRRNPLKAFSVPLALEEAGNLRTLQPKGSLIQERIASFQDRNLVPRKTNKNNIQKRRKVKVKGKETIAGDTIILG